MKKPDESKHTETVRLMRETGTGLSSRPLVPHGAKSSRAKTSPPSPPKLKAVETSNGSAPASGPEPFALPLAEFIAAESDAAPALVGTDEDCLLPAHGLVILGGKSGKGKTTLVIDAAFHLASGREWLGFAVARPLRVLMIENEGPREPFRRKLERKAKTWPHEIAGCIHIYASRWGHMSFADVAEAELLRNYVAAHEIDLIIGDPLGSLGAQGVGSPAETRDFVLLLKSLGLFSSVAFLLLHHFRKEPTNDEIDDLSGAWASHTDTILVLKMQAGNRWRLSFPKLAGAQAFPRNSRLRSRDRGLRVRRRRDRGARPRRRDLRAHALGVEVAHADRDR